MNNPTYIFISTISVLLTALLITFAIVPASFSQESLEEVSIVSISGKVVVLKKDALDWQAANPGDILTEGDKVRTHEGAKAKLQFTSGSTIVLNEKTTIVIEKLATKEKTEISVQKGKIKAVIESLLDKESEFEVRTPTAVAGVRGTVFYINVVKKDESIITAPTGKENLSSVDNKDKLSLADRIIGTRISYAQEEETFVTELFVEEGSVEFTNIISEITYNVGEGMGSYADEAGDITEPQTIPEDKQDQIKEGFDVGGTTGEEKKPEEPKKEETKKEEQSTTEKSETSTEEAALEEGTDTGAAEDTELAIDDEGIEDPDKQDIVDTKNTNNPTTTTESTETTANLTVTTKSDADGDGIADVDDDFPNDANFSKWTDSGDADNDNIPDGKEDYQLAEELKDLYNDINGITERIELAQLDAKLEEIQDAQTGKVVRDIDGNRVRVDSYVLRPTDNKVDIVYLSHRRDGTHAGVSSLSLEVTFNRSLAGVDLKTLPWSEYMASDNNITYSSQPTYYPKVNTTSFDPQAEEAAMILTMKNPDGDYLKVYEGFGALTDVDGSWQQAEVKPIKNMNFNGTFKRSSDSIHWTANGGEGYIEETFADNTHYKISGYVIDDYGNKQSTDTFTDNTTASLEIDSIRGILRADRKYNLEFIVEATEFNGRTIDLIVTPEVIEPYQDN
jgi:hypothetical protein